MDKCSSLPDDVQPIVKTPTQETTKQYSIETDSVIMPVMSLSMPTDIGKNSLGFYKKISLADKKRNTCRLYTRNNRI
jgi:hypothetical protein